MTARSKGSIEVQVPDAETEQQFLLLAVQAAVKTYRARHDGSPRPSPHARGAIA
jgi:hypothetical protein